jgi:ABC-2 type transport system ATP-binding protein
VLFLDEPTIGIDPVGARELRGLIGDLKAAGKTVLLTTHYMFEADELCDQIAVIRSGAIVAHGTPSELKAAVSTGHVLEVEAHGVAPDVVTAVRSLPGVRSVSIEEQGRSQLLLVQVDHGVEVAPGVLALLAGTSVGRVITRQPTLEDAYVELVGQTESAESGA